MNDAKEIDKRLDELEKTLRQVAALNSKSAFQSPYYLADELNLRALFGVLWSGKWWIVGVTLLFSVIGLLYAVSLPTLYQSKGIYAPAQKKNGSGGLAAQYSGLAAIAGINLTKGESSDIDQAMVLVKSWPFLESVVAKYELKPIVIAVNGWDRVTNELIWDRKIYDPIEKIWKKDTSSDQSMEPSSYTVYQQLNKLISVSIDSKTSLVTIAVEHYSPILAKEWVEMLAFEVNSYFRSRDTGDTKANIKFLEEKVQQTSISGMKLVFFQMIESQIQTLMLAESGHQYLIKTVVTPKIAEIQAGPKMLLIVLVGAAAGFFLALSAVLIKGIGLQLSKTA